MDTTALPMSEPDDALNLDLLIPFSPEPPSCPPSRARTPPDDLSSLTPLPSSLPPSSMPATPTPEAEQPNDEDGSSMIGGMPWRHKVVVGAHSDGEPPRTPPHTSTTFSDEARVARNGQSAAQAGRRLAQKVRVRTLAACSVARDEARNAELLAAVHETARALNQVQSQAEHEAAENRTQCFQAVLKRLQQDDLTWGDFVEWISTPVHGRCKHRYNGLFRNQNGQVAQILNLWADTNTPASKLQLRAWATSYLGKVVSKEANAVTQNGFLQSRRIPMTTSFIESFDLSAIHERIRELCPTMTHLMREFATTNRQRVQAGKPGSTVKAQDRQRKRVEKKETISVFHNLGKRN